jgi:hypothetical protein
MTALTKTFVVVASYLVVIGGVYWFITSEDAGTLLLLGTAVMLGLVAVYLARRGALERAPAALEDRPDGDVHAAAGTSVGSFPFASAWPIVLVGGLVLVALGILYTLILVPLGGVVAATAVVGLMRESRT